ncbi:cytochrome d ubiquinol oxidase subunit II [Corallincola holothuriorum]|uniref:Cytochrome d ubiquinol oxidase subunit II n=1 Tax=Corallincola holothuriorum TaxID=2282215 RepID=A0A368NNQ4_9GAMM|nr:cytochrome d ubiquinol oxidase subunit II [Corallincola holothuriorum]RCU51089.1 cytochrome d ubiquinol oxidase subunit II [Corallincola holothuriorum]
MIPADWLPVIFVGLMGLAVLIYAMLDGYDLGVGIMLPLDNETQADSMIASIGPFWDANETWLVLAIGLLLIAFPQAHSVVLRELYIPAAIMLIGLIMRGVAFDFRAKVAVANKPIWDKSFKLGSLITALAQGYMLGMYVMGFEQSITAYLFSGLAAFGVAAAYCYIGAAWLVMKTSDDLQLRAARWARRAGWICFAGVAAVCAMNPLVNPEILARWLSFPNALFVWAIPVVCFALFAIIDQVLKRFPLPDDKGCWLPFVGAMFIFLFCFSGLGYSFFPYIVPGQMTIWESASAPESLQFILWGAIVVVPVILLYTIFSYRVFWGKVQDLKYY